MNIPISIAIDNGKDGWFKIKSDDLQYTLYETRVYGKGSKRSGESYDTVHGYYSSIENCLSAIIDVSIKRSDAVTLQELIDDVRGIKELYR